MLKSEEMLNRFRDEEKKGSAEPGAEKPEGNNAGQDETHTATPPSSEGEGDGKPDDTVNTSTAHDSPKEDDWTRHDKEWKKRLDRQERAHRREVEAMRKELEALKAASTQKQEPLKREDFSSAEEWEEYREKQLVEKAKREILEEQQAQAEDERTRKERNAEVEKRVNDNFKDEAERAEFKEIVGDFFEEETEFLESENGQLYQEIIDNSVVGPKMALLIAKNEKALTAIKGMSKDMLYYNLKDLERTILAQKKPAEPAKELPKADPKKPASKIPDTGEIGNNAPAGGKFSARDWLKKTHPEQYK